LLRRPYGKEIDGHDIVIRFNAAPVGRPSFEITGNRTSIGIINSNSFRDPMTTEEGVIIHPNIFRGWSNAKTLQMLKSSPPEVREKIRVIEPHFNHHVNATFRKILEYLAGHNVNISNNPSSGFLSIVLFMPRCEYIDLYGFNTFPQRTIYNPDGTPVGYGHYWNLHSKPWQGHNFSWETFVVHAISVVYRDIITIRS
jgi:hypothetical protein